MAFSDTRQLEREFEKQYENFEGPLDSAWAWVSEGWKANVESSFDKGMQEDAKYLVDSGVFGEDAIMGGWHNTNKNVRHYAFSYDEEEMLHDLEKRLLVDQEKLSDDMLDALQSILDPKVFDFIDKINSAMMSEGTKGSIMDKAGADDARDNLEGLADSLKNLTEDVYDFGNAKEELFFGGKYGNVTGSLYKQVVKQGVGVLYNKMDIVMANNFHGFFNEQEAADRIIAVLNSRTAELSGA